MKFTVAANTDTLNHLVKAMEASGALGTSQTARNREIPDPKDLGLPINSSEEFDQISAKLSDAEFKTSMVILKNLNTLTLR